jgi:ABC-type antimicrobial peptide transport system permease subunit
MITHNLKIAWRNLMKYKMQNLVSAVALAVGMVTIAATHYVMKRYADPAITDEPYFNRTCVLKVYPINVDREKFNSYRDIKKDRIKHEVHNAICADGGLASAEACHPAFTKIKNRSIYPTRLTLNDTLVRQANLGLDYVSPGYMNFRGIRSAITGEKIGELKPGEAVISEYDAKRIFGDINPIGSNVEDLHIGTCTIRDVFKSFSVQEPLQVEGDLYTCLYEQVMENNSHNFNHYEIVLRPDCTPEQLKAEADQRLKPLEMEAEVKTMEEFLNEENRSIQNTRRMVYAICLFVLFAALSGFMRMQVQLFWMRRREVHLRMVHGAKRKSLMRTLATEVSLSLIAVYALAACFATWLIHYANRQMLDYLQTTDGAAFSIHTSLLTILFVVATVCVISIWATLQRMLSRRQNMYEGLQRRSGNALRNTMLAVQFTISLVFFSITLSFMQNITKIKAELNIPTDESRYEESLIVEKTIDGNSFEAFLKNEAKDMKQYFRFGEIFNKIKEITQDSIKIPFANGNDFFRTTSINDTTFFDYWQRPIKWLVPFEKRQKNCVLLSERLYHELDSVGIVQKGTIHIQIGAYESSENPLTIAGTFHTLPYNDDKLWFQSLHMITLNMDIDDSWMNRFIIVPEKGKYDSVKDEVEGVIKRLNPISTEQKVFHLKSKYAERLVLFEKAENIAWILSAVCLIICLMGIWNAIVLDTRLRQKEVAVRKVHGAKRKDIALLFGRLYLWLLTIATMVSYPLFVVLVKSVKKSSFNFLSHIPMDSIYQPLALSVAIIALVTLLIISVHIRKVMKVNPAEIIAKE